MKSYLGKDILLVEELKCLLEKQQKTIATAESCTGGIFATVLTELSGSSKFYRGGVCCYSNESKVKVLHVSEELLQEQGAISKEVAQVLASHVCKSFGADLGVSLTGVAGPLGGTRKNPVGNIWYSIYHDGVNESSLLQLAGDRYTIRTDAIKQVLKKTIEILEGL